MIMLFNLINSSNINDIQSVTVLMMTSIIIIVWQISIIRPKLTSIDQSVTMTSQTVTVLLKPWLRWLFNNDIDDDDIGMFQAIIERLMTDVMLILTSVLLIGDGSIEGSVLLTNESINNEILKLILILMWQTQYWHY